jgi:hypothetical protein
MLQALPGKQNNKESKITNCQINKHKGDVSHVKTLLI